MERITLSKKQSQQIAQSVYSGIIDYCEKNFDRLFNAYLEERSGANGKPIDPIHIRFDPRLRHEVINWLKVREETNKGAYSQ